MSTLTNFWLSRVILKTGEKALSEVLFMIFVFLFVLCCMLSYTNFAISLFMIAIR